MAKYLSLLCLFFLCITAQAQFSTTVQTEFQNVMDTFNSHYNLIGLSVAVQNANSTWASANGISTSTDSINNSHKFAIGSVSKTITSATILQMYEEGLLDLEDSVTQHLGLIAWVTPSITIRQLLNHTSGLYNYTQHPDLVKTIFYNSTTMVSTSDIFNKYMKGSSFSPGQGWKYSNTNYVLLGMIIEKISGKTYYEEARDRFSFTTKYPSLHLSPFELSTDSLAHLWIDTIGNGTYFDVQTSSISTNALFSSAGAAGAYVATPKDLAQWAYDLYHGKILKPETMLELLDTVPNSEGYGLGVLVHPSDCNLNIHGHNGGIYYRSATFYSKEKDIAVSIHTNDANEPVILESLAKELLCIYCGPTEIKESLIKENISVYPNPVLSELTIENKQVIPLLEIYNSRGTKLTQFTPMSKTATLDLTMYKGVLFLKIFNTNSSSKMIKVIVL